MNLDEINQRIELANYGVRYAQNVGAEEVEVFISSEDIQRAQIENSKVSTVQHVFDSGAFIRLYKKSALGSAVVTDLSKKSIADGVDKSLKLAIVKEDKVKCFPFPKGAQGIHIDVDDKIDKLQPSELVDFTKRLVDSIKAVERKVKATDGLVSSSVTTTTIANSNGLSVSDSNSKMIAGVRSRIKKGLKWGSGYDYSISSNLDDVNPDLIGRKSAELSIASLKRSSIEPGQYTVVFEPHAFSDLVKSLLMQAACGNNVKKKSSFLKDKCGQPVAGDNFTLIDDGTLSNGVNKGYVDHEGTLTQRTLIIEKGLLKNLLYDHASAMNEGTISTGNGIRYFSPLYERIYRFTPMVEGTNLVLERGDHTREEMIETVKEGLLVTFLVGSWSFNFSNGSFSADMRSCFKIENGEVKQSLDEATISGNILDLIKDLQIGNNSTQSRGYIPLSPATVITPSVRSEKVKVTT